MNGLKISMMQGTFYSIQVENSLYFEHNFSYFVTANMVKVDDSKRDGMKDVVWVHSSVADVDVDDSSSKITNT